MSSFAECVINKFLIWNKEIIPEAPNGEFVSFVLDSKRRCTDFGGPIIQGHLQYRIPIKNSRGKLMRNSANLFIKILPQISHFPQTKSSSFANESFFYTKMIPHFESAAQHFKMPPIDQLFPKFCTCHMSLDYVTPTESGDEGVLVLENLKFSGYVPYTKSSSSFLDYDHLALMMRKLGQFHSYSSAARAQLFKEARKFMLLSESFISIPLPSFGRELDFLQEPALRGVNGLQESNPPEIIVELEDIMKNADQKYWRMLITDHSNDPMSVLCHGDYSVSNVLFKYNENKKPIDLKIVNMAKCRLSPPATDIANVFCLHTNQEMRDRHWDDLMQEYMQGLGSTQSDHPTLSKLITLPTIEQILAQFPNVTLLNYFNACCFFNQQTVSSGQYLPTNEMVPWGECSYSSPQPYNLYERPALTRSSKLVTKSLAEILLDMFKRGYIRNSPSLHN